MMKVAQGETAVLIACTRITSMLQSQLRFSKIEATLTEVAIRVKLDSVIIRPRNGVDGLHDDLQETPKTQERNA